MHNKTVFRLILHVSVEHCHLQGVYTRIFNP